MLRWLDAGIAWTIEIATSGDLIAGGQQTDIPIVAGGPSGVPLGWQPYLLGTGAAVADVNITTASNTFSISNKTVVTVGRFYGATYDMMPVQEGIVYRLSFDIRTMAGKSAARRNYSIEAYNGSTFVAGLGSGSFASTLPDYETIVRTALAPFPAGADRLKITIYWGSQSVSPPVDWAAQITNVFVIGTDPSPEPIEWQDVTCDVMALSTRYGRERFTNRYDVGTAQLMLNNELGTYTYRAIHAFNLRPGRLCRGTVTYGLETFPMFYGVIDSLTDGFTLDGHAVTNINVLDPTSLYSTMPTPTIYGYAFNYKSGYRILGLLDAVGYLNRAVDVGQFNMQPIIANGRSIRDEMGVTADSEGGSLFADREGDIVYRDRTWAAVDPTLQTVSAQFLAGPIGTPFEIDTVPTYPDAAVICTNELETDWSRDRIINRLELANAGGTTEVYEDEDSQRAHGVATYQRTDFVNEIASSNSLGYLATRANDIMTGYSDPVLRVNSVSYRPDVVNDFEAWRFTLAAFTNRVVRIWYLHPRNLWGFAVASRIQSVTHRVTVKDWATTMTVDAPLAFTELIYSDHGWDYGNWDEAEWDQT